ncbi:Biogenesis of lysosome-related organelles complex 1 subunit 2 [Geodia barretti]|uniref:Biogenesis of lysosome-related organelles complex 1 subunit 2 n=1 Tax=Geodia barretti TaxID=519541 RepID=A0AA35VZ13_GEOBA|nr:Biogenesis of lysosome-related organelles complex 1 subunit 2 [Geodia barretti]
MSSEESVKEEEKEKEETVEAEGSAGEDVASERNAQCYEMFEKVAEYLNGELAATSEEYALLQRLNQITLNKYQDMTALASRLNEVSQRLNDKCQFLSPLLSLIFLNNPACFA